MRAAVVPRHGPPDVIEVRTDWPEPGPPGDGEVLFAVEAAGLNPSDTGIRRGGRSAPLPYVSGREAAGRVLAVGAGVSGLLPGDPVFSFFQWNARPGGHAEMCIVPASMVAKRPPDTPVVEAAGVPLAGLSAFQALRVLDPPRGERILVTAGAGGVGHFAVQLAVRRGLEVVATAGPANREFVMSLGASEVADYHDPDHVKRMSGVRYLLDAVGGANIALYTDVLGEGARVAGVAGVPAQVRADVKATPIGARPGAEDLSELARLLGNGELSTTVQEVFPLERVAEAHALLEGRHVRGKLVISLAV